MNYANEIIGGSLIGLASAIPLLSEGRMAGISGYAASALRPTSREGRTSLALIVGLVIGGILWRWGGGETFRQGTPASLPLWIVAGFLVGFGSRLGGGCTSGHGVCGLGRMAPRSAASVGIFMTAAIATVLLRTRGLA